MSRAVAVIEAGPFIALHGPSIVVRSFVVSHFDARVVEFSLGNAMDFRRGIAKLEDIGKITFDSIGALAGNWKAGCGVYDAASQERKDRKRIRFPLRESLVLLYGTAAYDHPFGHCGLLVVKKSCIHFTRFPTSLQVALR